MLRLVVKVLVPLLAFSRQEGLTLSSGSGLKVQFPAKVLGKGVGLSLDRLPVRSLSLL